MSKDTFDYDFNTVNAVDYNLKLESDINSRTIKSIFEVTKRGLSKRNATNNNIGSVNMQNIIVNEDGSEYFELPPGYCKLIKIGITKLINIINKQLKEDKIDILTYDIKRAKFTRSKGDNWKLNVDLEGQYVDRR